MEASELMGAESNERTMLHFPFQPMCLLLQYAITMCHVTVFLTSKT